MIFEKVALKSEAFLKFVVSQEKRLDIIFKSLVGANSMTKEMRKSVKPVGTKPGTYIWTLQSTLVRSRWLLPILVISIDFTKSCI